MHRFFQKIKQFVNHKEGVSSIEFTLTIGIFLTVLFVLFEFGRIALLSAYWDLAIAEGVRLTKNQKEPSGDYATLLKKEITKQYQSRSGNDMAFLVPDNPSLSVDVKYADSIDNLVKGIEGNVDGFRKAVDDGNGKKILPTGQLAAIVKYRLQYNYEFLVALPFIGAFVNSLFTREVLVVQENERSKFKE
ncbi:MULTISPECIES: TadE family protein [Pasteurellaceae]|uniref:Pilus assembly protein n=1 Tax=Pasteurella atlantica TaxID=2827233 RepID=A0AAW8CLN2_9PAST|nr:TadE family protein [Pasteurella atlantica]MBR0573538.1 pilus assembly protein [Pasteurella atlantica]MDP8039603.1 pilus assembly protein [Pasteurella atlantica]MDP8041694.1 pilus assembly protein [Pasteurella atlantica]MDP8043829.1 pilus assembly protein [Pasteurella atlantica]MDP8045915.1 pilus assembly protein [Pasteurella atlantica]